MASTDEAYIDECLPGGSPFRPLYDDKIKFNNQPIALVLAEESEIARFAATLVHIDYEAGNTLLICRRKLIRPRGRQAR